MPVVERYLVIKSVDVVEPLDIKSSKIWYPMSSPISKSKLGVRGVQLLAISPIIEICSIIGID